MSIARSDGRLQPARAGDPTRVGPYRIVGRLGSGGMGTVHAGLDPSGLRVAIKLVHASHAEDPEFRARFRREVQLSARVQGPCLLPLLAADPDAETPWLATAYAPGLTLDQHLAAHGPLTGGTLYAFATGTAQALAVIHAAGVIHRDVKPQNVILTPAGPLVLDFGIAHAADGTSVTRTGVMTGTPGWISPEHYRTGSAGPEGDVFAWGALVAYAATDRLPFGTGSPDVVAYRIMSTEPDLDGLPEGLRETVAKALTKNPDQRITSDSAAQECARLLSAQATQVLAADSGSEPTSASDLITTEWHVPSVEDPGWQVPTMSARKRALIGLIAVATASAAVAGAIVALDSTGQDRPHIPAKGVASPAAPVDKPAEATASASPGSTRTASPRDPRTVKVPVDPLAGAVRPTFTRGSDRSEPHPDEWRTSTRFANPREQNTEQAIRNHITSMLTTKGLEFMEPEITFNLRAQTVIVTGGPVPQLPENYQQMFQRASHMAACTALAHQLGDSPTSWPYGRFSIHWKMSDADTEAAMLGYGKATGGCFSEIAGQWRGDESGMVTAEIPSSATGEIRVADAAVKDITATWNRNTAQTNEEPLSTSDGINLGFDPVENAAYVWTADPDNRFGSRASQSNLQGAVEEAVCRKLTAEFNADKKWNYTRWTVAAYDPYIGGRQFIGSGVCTP
ncbi:serine/threonine-protein kinase [Streptomyces albipurpureus]|uniref:Serine/threonine protein kinase n=1 Tax=Streptomyces albipurpureus TaxID=2897419 RepID=A0ABT0UJK3_9ACTN|nr:serine/threonine-protein kinase [Streptomyces sp. CWNU-1]MCM2388280.1 serine/threonine protein kinase [Streptomyces sp. CWNU-1]